MIIGEKKVTSKKREGFNIGRKKFLSTEGSFSITKLPIFNNKLKISNSSPVYQVEVLHENGELERLPVYDSFSQNMFMMMKNYPKTYFFDKDGYLNGIWELDCRKTYYFKTSAYGKNLQLHSLYLKPSLFRELGKFEMKRDSVEDWLMTEYELEKVVK